MASMTPEASGAKPVEAAMSSIEPVNLPESAVWGLLAQPVDPVYPDAAKASGQKGSVVLQVFIGRDGAVQDAKFLQGSLVFARVRHRRGEAVALQALFHEWPGGFGAERDHAEFQAAGLTDVVTNAGLDRL